MRFAPSRAGWGAALLVGPHLLLGTWLAVVPDHLAFTASQVITLLHVVLAVVTFPLVAVWTFVHVRKMRPAEPHRTGTKGASWSLAAVVALACLTGVVVIWGGRIHAAAPLHAIFGIAVGLPLAWHLWLAARRFAATATVALVGIALAGSFAARRWLPPRPLEAVVPAFAFATRDAQLYEPAENCGECHEEQYRDWKRSTHSRTLELHSVQEALERAKVLLGVRLSQIGEALSDEKRPLSPELVAGACAGCHAPAGFYGNDAQSLLHPAGLVAEGTGCTFCHTVREVRENRNSPLPHFDQRTLSRADISALVSRAPFFVSAPETVRRYLFQGSQNRLARTIANYLIRWRPSIHSADYHSPVLDDSRACLPCHSLGIDSPDVPHMTYYGWEHSPFNTGKVATTVHCQDCHMVNRMTGLRADEAGRQVPWGPIRRGVRSHLFVGGNVQAASSFHDEDLARREHALNALAASVAVSRVERVADVLNVTVAVRSEQVGHYFPALETQLRYGWVQLTAFDAAGKVLGSTPKPRDSQDFGCASPLIMASTDDPKPDNRRLVEPRSSREFTGHLSLPAGAQVDRVLAELHQFVDPSPIASATWSTGTARP